MSVYGWVEGLAWLRSTGSGAALATITHARGHSPREVGAKMVISPEYTFGSIGGGNMEATIIDSARRMLRRYAGGDEDQSRIETHEFGLNEHAHNHHGTQCCGGVVEVLVELIPAPPVVAVFGLGHVGEEIARILSRHDIILHLADSRAGMLSKPTLDTLNDAPAVVHVHTPPAPESVLSDLPAGTHVLILTHDHAEDLTLLDQALRTGGWGSIGVIGSRAKWLRFRKKLLELGHTETSVETIACPIGLPDIPGKHPAIIGVSVAADLLRILTKAHT